MAVRERGDGARQTRGRREEGRKVAVRMTCVGGVREHDETRNCDGMTQDTTRANLRIPRQTCVSLVVAVLQGEYRTNLPHKMGLNGSLITRGPAAGSVENTAKTSTLSLALLPQGGSFAPEFLGFSLRAR